MAVSLTTPEMIINDALAKIGYVGRVNSIYEGTPQSKKALDVFAQCRDALLCKLDFDFSQKIAPLVTSTGAAPAPWSFEWLYPSDALKIRAVFPSTYVPPYNNPSPLLYKLGDSAAFGKVVWTQVNAPTVVYTAQVPTIGQWDATFIELLTNLLGKTLAPALQKLDEVKIADADLKEGLDKAMAAPE